MRKIFLLFCLNFWNQQEIFNVLKKNEPTRSSISEVIDSVRYAYLSAGQGLLLKTVFQ